MEAGYNLLCDLDVSNLPQLTSFFDLMRRNNATSMHLHTTFAKTLMFKASMAGQVLAVTNDVSLDRVILKYAPPMMG